MMRRVECPRCGVTVEQVPWADGKHHLTTPYMWFLATWAKRLSWQEVARAFRTSWDHVFRSVAMAVAWGLPQGRREEGWARAAHPGPLSHPLTESVSAGGRFDHLHGVPSEERIQRCDNVRWVLQLQPVCGMRQHIRLHVWQPTV